MEQPYRDAAVRLGRLLAENGIRLVYGGGRIGLMGLCADAALAAGGQVTGVIPNHLHDVEVGHTGLTELIVTDDMHSRKAKMFELSDAFAILPGGLGTLDETLEILTWRQLGLHDKPVLIVNVGGYWAPLMDLLGHVVAKGFASPSVAGLFQVVESVDAVIRAIREAPEERLSGRTELI